MSAATWASSGPKGPLLHGPLLSLLILLCRLGCSVLTDEMENFGQVPKVSAVTGADMFHRSPPGTRKAAFFAPHSNDERMLLARVRAILTHRNFPTAASCAPPSYQAAVHRASRRSQEFEVSLWASGRGSPQFRFRD